MTELTECCLYNAPHPEEGRIWHVIRLLCGVEICRPRNGNGDCNQRQREQTEEGQLSPCVDSHIPKQGEGDNQNWRIKSQESVIWRKGVQHWRHSYLRCQTGRPGHS